MPRINVGLIGLGEVAQLVHLPLLADDPRFRIAAVTDVSPSLTEHIAPRYNVEKRPETADELLPTRLEITTSSDTETGTEIIGPVYEDPFRIELDAFHHGVITGTRPKTTLADSLADLELFAEVGAQFLR